MNAGYAECCVDSTEELKLRQRIDVITIAPPYGFVEKGLRLPGLTNMSLSFVVVDERRKEYHFGDRRRFRSVLLWLARLSVIERYFNDRLSASAASYQGNDRVSRPPADWYQVEPGLCMNWLS